MEDGLVLASHMGYSLGSAVRFLRDSEHWTRSEIRQHQARMLHSLIEHCYEHVPYYKELMTALSLRPEDFRGTEDLSKLPYLTREIIRKEGARLRADNYPDSTCIFRRSGGTTGEPIRVAVDRRARGFETGAYLRGLQWMKYEMGRPMVRLFGGSLGLESRTDIMSKIRDWAFNSRFLPAFELRQDNLARYVNVIREADQGILIGYASVVLNLAELMCANGFQGTPLKSVVCTAEYMPDEWRTRIQTVLGAPVFCYYGCGEINSIGYECAGEEGYIVPEEHVVLEVGGEQQSVFRDVGNGEACVTALCNYAMPLIRYLNGDLIGLNHAESGHAHVRIVNLHGRVVDQLIRYDGNRVGGAFVPHLVFRSGCPVWKYQVIQTSTSNIDFHYLMREGESLSLEMQGILREAFQRHMGERMVVRFVSGEFEASRSGKHRFVINCLEE